MSVYGKSSVSLRPGEGAYRNGAYSGLVTGVAAAGHLWAARFVASGNRQLAVIQRLRVRAFTVAGYTAAQEVLLSVWGLTAYTAAHTGGAAVTPVKKRTSFPSALMTGRASSGTALTPGTQTLSTDPIASGAYAELAAAATVQKGKIDILLSTEDLILNPIELANQEGLLVRNEILQGAGGTMRLVVEMEWREVESR